MTTLDDNPTTLTAPPDATGRFGEFGGRFVPETLVPAFDRLEQGVREFLHDEDFQAEFRREVHVREPRRAVVARIGHPFRPGDRLGREVPAPVADAVQLRGKPREERSHRGPGPGARRVGVAEDEGVLGALIVLVIGWLIASGLSRVVRRLLKRTNLDDRLFCGAK